jgi:excisionase family DNA binding protein
MYTIGTAAKATGKSKSTISRDVEKGKISAVKNEDGSFAIDPAELHRGLSAGWFRQRSQ